MKGTIFCDVDGTLVVHNDLTGSKPHEWLPGAKERLLSWLTEYRVVLTTSRTEIKNLALFFLAEGLPPGGFSVIHNLPLGPRYLINDRSAAGDDKAFAINVNRNQGLTDVVLE